MKTTRIAVIGSREYNNEAKILRTMEACELLYKARGDSLIWVSGGCPKGADKHCRKIALEKGWAYEEFPPAHDPHNKYCVLSEEKYGHPYHAGNFIKRNDEIAARADLVMAFIVRGKPFKGTHRCTDSFEKLGKKVIYFWDVE